MGADALRAIDDVNDVRQSCLIVPGTDDETLGFNITLEPFTDVRVRQAFNSPSTS